MGAESQAELAPPKNIDIENVFHEAFMSYAMSVIVSRALPDVRDGLKPVHRRIIYAMDSGPYGPKQPYKKAARIVGDVMGVFHPHGDGAIYDTMVRMAQDFSLRTPLVDGQGNFGSLDGDRAAAMRYTEARMTNAAADMTMDIDLGTVDFVPNYDGKDTEPTVLPTRIPNLLINGNTGIAVGMATNMPPHNPHEAINACIHVLDHPEATLDDVMEILPGPDFPTGGVIQGMAGIRSAYETGKGTIYLSGVAEIEELKNGKSQIVVSELPYTVLKSAFQEKIKELVNSKAIEGIESIRDESDRDENVRVVIGIKKQSDPALILNKLKKHTSLVNTFSVNSVCLNERGEPQTLTLMEQIHAFVNFRMQVVRRRTVFKLDKNRDKLAKELGLYAAVSEVDDVVDIIRKSPDTDTARQRLLGREFPVSSEFRSLLEDADPDQDEGEIGDVYHLTNDQVTSILEMKLSRLTGLERDKIAQSARETSGIIRGLMEILNDKGVLHSTVRLELEEMAAKYATEERRTTIQASEHEILTDEDLIEKKDVVITFTNGGYVKRTFLDAYREQKRGGKGKSGMNTKDGDFVSSIITCSTHSPLIFFTSRGMAHSKKAFQLPEGAASARGRAIVNDLPQLRVHEGEKVSSVLALPTDQQDIEQLSMVFVTDFGSIRRSQASDFLSINKRGKMAMQLEDETGNPVGKLVNVLLCRESDTILLATKRGIAARIRVGDIRTMNSRKSTGVRGISLEEGDQVISATHLEASPYSDLERQAYLAGGKLKVGEQGEEEIFELSDDMMRMMREKEQFLLTVSENGYGKRSSVYEFRTTGRGRKGIICMEINDVTGPLLSCFPVEEDDGIMLVDADGQTIRVRVPDTNIQRRVTRGVRLFKMDDDKTVATVARIISPDPD